MSECYPTAEHYFGSNFRSLPKAYENGTPSLVNEIGQLKQLQTLLDNKKAMQEQDDDELDPVQVFNAQLAEYKKAMLETFAKDGSASDLFKALQGNLNDSIVTAQQHFPVQSRSYNTNDLWTKDPAAMQRLHFSVHHYRYTVRALECSQRQQISLLPVVKTIFAEINKQIIELEAEKYFMRDGIAKIKALNLLKDELTAFNNRGKTVNEIVNQWQKLKKFKYSKTQKVSTVAQVIGQHRNMFRDENRKKPTGTQNLIDKLMQEHGGIRIELAMPSEPRQYNSCRTQ